MELRRNVRVSLRARVTLRGTDAAGRAFAVQAQSVDFSRRGLGLLLNGDVVAPGSVVAVEKPRSFASDAVVRWCRPSREKGQTRVGLQLIRPNLTVAARIAAGILLMFAFVGQVSFARWRGHARPVRPDPAP